MQEVEDTGIITALKWMSRVRILLFGRAPETVPGLLDLKKFVSNFGIMTKLMVAYTFEKLRPKTNQIHSHHK
jgi:hypothetical protein